MTDTPALDALTRDARRLLADHFDEIEVDPTALPGDRPVEAAWRAARTITSHEWDGHADPDRPDPIDAPDARLRLLLDAFRELRDTREDNSGSGRDAVLAVHLFAVFRRESKVLADIAQLDLNNANIDAAAIRAGLTGLCRALAAFLVLRAGGLLEDAQALQTGPVIP